MYERRHRYAFPIIKAQKNVIQHKQNACTVYVENGALPFQPYSVAELQMFCATSYSDLM